MNDTGALKALIVKWRITAMQSANAMNALCGGKGFSEKAASLSECAAELESTLERMLASQGAEPVAYLYRLMNLAPHSTTSSLSFHKRQDLIDAGWSEFPLSLFSAQPGIVPGWVMVPEEPTPEMLDAGLHESEKHAARYSLRTWLYKTMIAAAPSASLAEPDVEAMVRELADQMLIDRIVIKEAAAIIRKHLRPTQQTEGASAAPQAEGK